MTRDEPTQIHHLAQLDLGLFRAPLDSDEMVEFRLALESIYALIATGLPARGCRETRQH